MGSPSNAGGSISKGWTSAGSTAGFPNNEPLPFLANANSGGILSLNAQIGIPSQIPSSNEQINYGTNTAYQ